MKSTAATVPLTMKQRLLLDWLQEELDEMSAACFKTDKSERDREVDDAFRDMLGIILIALADKQIAVSTTDEWHRNTQATRGRVPLFDLEATDALIATAASDCSPTLVAYLQNPKRRHRYSMTIALMRRTS